MILNEIVGILFIIMIFINLILIAPKAQFQLVAVCDVVDFGCPPGMYVCMFVGALIGLMLNYLGTDAVEIAKH